MINFRSLAHRSSKANLVFVGILVLSTPVYAQSPPEVLLQQMVEQLQSDPGDTDLRQKIIRLAREISPGPGNPEEANRNFIKGNVFLQEAKDTAGYGLAISAYKAALLVAPWWSDAYYNLSIAQESAGEFAEAIASVRYYKASVMQDGAEAQQAQNRIYTLEAKMEMAVLTPEVEQPRPGVDGNWDLNGFIDFKVSYNGNGYYLAEGKLAGQYGTWNATNVVIDPPHVSFTVEQPGCPQCKASYALDLSTSGNELTGVMINHADGSRNPATFLRMP